MAATSFTPISLYYSSTASNVPIAGNLVAGELAINTNDGKLFYKDSSGVVQVLATKGGVGSSTTTQVLYNTSGLVVGSANLTFNGTTLTTANDASISGLTVGKGGGAVATNTAVGNGAGYSNVTGAQNTFIGQTAGYSNTNSYNTFLGWQTGYSVTSGTQNTCLGFNSGYSMTTGSKNTILGPYTGNQGGLDIRTASNYIVLSDGDGNPRGIFDNNGNFLVGTTSQLPLVSAKFNFVATLNQRASVTGNGSVGEYMTNTSGTVGWTPFSFCNNGTSFSQIGSITTTSVATLYNTTSDRRLKENIVDAPSGNINDIKVRSFDWITDGTHQTYGMVAQELVEVAPYAVHQPQDSEAMMAVDYSKLVPMMIKEIQDLKQRIATLEAK